MLIATEHCVYRIESPAEGRPERIYRDGKIRFVAEHRDLCVIALDDGSLVVWDDAKGHRRIDSGVPLRIDCLLLLNANPLELLIGTLEARLFRLLDNGRPAQPIDTFDALACRSQWFTPWGGPPSVRSLAGVASGDVYADIHVGSIMHSPDHGRSWSPANPTIHQDVHQVATCPAAQNRVYANTQKAVFISEDRGQSWRDCGQGLGHRYGRAIAPHPDDPDLLLASVSDGPHEGRGQLFRSEDAGRSWTHLTDGLPGTTAKNIDTHHVGFDGPQTAWVCVEDRLYVSLDRGRRWEEFWQADSEIRMIAPAM